jgi:hypothetical protein
MAFALLSSSINQAEAWRAAQNREIEVTLQDLGNIGEFVGAIGVVASLIYHAL